MMATALLLLSTMACGADGRRPRWGREACDVAHYGNRAKAMA
jgi:hypothetical protein